LNRDADVVFGSRFKGKARDGEKHGAYFFNTLANHVLTFLSNQLSGLRLSDIAACYKAFRREVITQFTIEEARFGIDAELVMKCAKLAREKGVHLAEVEIGYRARSFEEGKKLGGATASVCFVQFGSIDNGRKNAEHRVSASALRVQSTGYFFEKRNYTV